ncbi:MAG: NAD-dependent epimerase/dehydratase family protein [Myxococcaceae bacterium]|nr:NAD-dependent epimerase/dehydratase family protein [Myxococcaceae bacterium]
MNVVTGASGHLGNVLVRHLLERGERVRAFVRPSSDVTSLEGLACEQVHGDVRDRASLERAFDGATRVFHCAGLVSITAGKEALLTATNVEGTQNVIDVCIAKGVKRLVYMSSVHALTEPLPGGTLDESGGFDPTTAHGAYGKSKAAASKRVQDAAREGRLDAVLVLPTGVLGPHDYLCSEAGQLVGMTGTKRVPIIVAGGYDWVDVRDIADGTLLAAEKGKTGEAYLLNQHYLTNVELCRIVAEAAGVRAPLYALPLWLARIFAYGGLAYELVTGRRALLTPYSVHTIGKRFTISSQKARDQLGFTPRPLADTLVDAWHWQSTHPDSPLLKKVSVAPARRALVRGAK